MSRIIPLGLIGLLLLALVPVAQAAWTTSASVPSSFRPDRDVTFTYTASSSSGVDLAIRWRVTLTTCQDTNANTWCEPTDANRVEHGERTLTPTGGSSQTATWTVNLKSAEGTYRYHFHTTCIDSPCVGTPPGGSHNKTGAFQLAYTNTWTRTVVATNPTSVGSSQTITYRMTSASVDDRDLAGTAELFSRPPGQGETSAGAKPYTANANSVTNLQWPGIAFPEIGAHRLRVADTNAADSTLDVTVRGVHLHVIQPRPIYPEGARVSLYFALEGHGSTPDPAPIPSQDIQLVVRNGTYTLVSATARTDGSGRAYANITTPNDATALTWTASTSGTWLGIAYSLTQPGEILFAPVASADHDALEENVTAIRENLSDVQLKGVHLDDVGARNLWMSILRGTGAVALVVLLVLLILFIAFRV